MLSQPICKRCARLDDWVDRDFWETVWDENRVVMCPSEYARNHLEGYERPLTVLDVWPWNLEPPHWCPYALEHIMESCGHAQ